MKLKLETKVITAALRKLEKAAKTMLYEKTDLRVHGVSQMVIHKDVERIANGFRTKSIINDLERNEYQIRSAKHQGEQ